MLVISRAVAVKAVEGVEGKAGRAWMGGAGVKEEITEGGVLTKEERGFYESGRGEYVKTHGR